MRRWGFAPFCAACPARHAVVASLARTLGRAGRAMQCSIKVSALRREQNSHNAAEPRKANHLQHKAGPQMHAKPRLTKCQSCGMRRSGTKTKDMAKVHQLKLPHCVGCTGFQSVCWATGINTSTFCAGLWQRWLKCVAGHGRIVTRWNDSA